MAQNIPVKLVGLRSFLNDTEFATADITLPSLTQMTDTLSGAGILGELDLPSPGHYSSLELGVAWKTINTGVFSIAGAEEASMEFRGAFQEYEVNKGLVTKAIKIVIRGHSKGIDLGTLAQNAATDTSNTVEITYIKIFIEGSSVFELDKFNYIFRINGKDALYDVRKALGYN
ncbi:phage tail protein [Paenibacillus faecis]|uniref:Phage tail protein n=1 Tax=Paenibacillus faecis TaxID=862114 RepID=A0A5D0CLN9_9BACL|nr:phage major tail tube protein [Paenibacillus faecis]TYA10929.1 phage tail protein [Paenibacillus faecis]